MTQITNGSIGTEMSHQGKAPADENVRNAADSKRFLTMCSIVILELIVVGAVSLEIALGGRDFMLSMLQGYDPSIVAKALTNAAPYFELNYWVLASLGLLIAGAMGLAAWIFAKRKVVTKAQVLKLMMVASVCIFIQGTMVAGVTLGILNSSNQAILAWGCNVPSPTPELIEVCSQI